LLRPLRRLFGAERAAAFPEPAAAPSGAAGVGADGAAARSAAQHAVPPHSAAAHSASPHSAAPQSAVASGAAGTAGPLVIQHTFAAEPNALKLQVSRMLLALGDVRRYADAQQASESPLAQALFALGGLEHLEITSAGITALMREDADWDGLMKRVPEALRAHLEAGLPVVTAVATDSAASTGKRYRFGFQQVTRTSEEQFEMVQRLFEDEINPAVAQHGGRFTLLEIKDNKVFVQLGGGCQGCGMADVTLRQGVEQRLREVLPEMVALVDVTDHANGENPYYQPSR
jgi:Fe-S cluster biogenesis protein NfuA